MQNVLHRDDGSGRVVSFWGNFHNGGELRGHRLFYDEMRFSIMRTNNRGR
jgi:hypothetical protein